MIDDEIVVVGCLQHLAPQCDGAPRPGQSPPDRLCVRPSNPPRRDEVGHARRILSDSGHRKSGHGRLLKSNKASRTTANAPTVARIAKATLRKPPTADFRFNSDAPPRTRMLADANNTSKYAKSASFCAPLGGNQSYGQVGMSHASSMRSIPVTMPAVTNIRTVISESRTPDCRS